MEKRERERACSWKRQEGESGGCYRHFRIDLNAMHCRLFYQHDDGLISTKRWGSLGDGLGIIYKGKENERPTIMRQKGGKSCENGGRRRNVEHMS